LNLLRTPAADPLPAFRGQERPRHTIKTMHSALGDTPLG
jgi:hypothetical protein